MYTLNAVRSTLGLFTNNYSTGKQGNRVTKLTGKLILIGQLNNLVFCIFLTLITRTYTLNAVRSTLGLFTND